MKFIVEPQKEEMQHGCRKYITMCALCDEDPRFCGSSTY